MSNDNKVNLDMDGTNVDVKSNGAAVIEISDPIDSINTPKGQLYVIIPNVFSLYY